ncbi:MAG: HPr family phosphocarrier protein [Deltaproteobacteria bacterium]|nr:HPr family phosphocarrier protein [Deltaproteobacteria bacterium]MBW1927639.1 HPr family phosphocarrier protein [Deltaproteobacteria bacterium]MBW2025592.1 HPr family phosphocarrier protein [Deltaproteobacteria bacterium]
MEESKILKVRNNLGLHARAAAKIVELVKRHNSELYLRKDDQEVDGSSILSILTLACPKGTELQVRAVGEDSPQLLEALEQLFEDRFGEGQ